MTILAWQMPMFLVREKDTGLRHVDQKLSKCIEEP